MFPVVVVQLPDDPVRRALYERWRKLSDRADRQPPLPEVEHLAPPHDAVMGTTTADDGGEW